MAPRQLALLVVLAAPAGGLNMLDGVRKLLLKRDSAFLYQEKALVMPGANARTEAAAKTAAPQPQGMARGQKDGRVEEIQMEPRSLAAAAAEARAEEDLRRGIGDLGAVRDQALRTAQQAAAEPRRILRASPPAAGPPRLIG